MDRIVIFFLDGTSPKWVGYYLVKQDDRDYVIKYRR